MSRKSPVSEYRFADVAIDAADFRVRQAGEIRKITPRAFEVLLYLVEHRGRTVEKQEIFEQIWRDQFVSDNALTRIVKEIRRVLGDEASAPRFIETVPKRGYRFIAEVEEIAAPEAASAAENAADQSFKPDDSPPFAHQKPRPPYLILTAALAFAALVLLGGWLFFNNRNAANAPAIERTSQITRGSGLDNFPAISADGKLLAYSSDQSGSFEIYVKPIASDAREIQITADANQNFQPAFSPDGQRLAFHSKTRGGIWIAPVSGGTARQLTDFGSHPEFSPDGSQIAFQTGGLTDLGAASRTIPPSVLWTVAADGTNPRQLTQAGNPIGGHSSPRWSPDGSRVVFNVEDSSSFGFWSIRVRDGKLQKISSMGFDPVYAPDGKRIYYASFNGLWQIPVSSGDDRPTGEATLLADDGPAQIRSLRISADGKKLVYAMMMSGSNLATIDLDSKGEAVGNPSPFLPNSAFRNATPIFSPDGSRVVYTTWQTGARGRLWIADSDGQNPTEMVQNAGIPSWFADGVRIGFISQLEGAPQFRAINAATGRGTTLYTFKSEVNYAKISPDGKTLAFNSKEGGTINVRLANIETGEEKQLTFDQELAGFPIWSPDGKTLAVQIKRGDDTHIVLVSANGGEIAQLTNERGQSWAHSFSQDGERVIFAGQRGDVWNVYSVSRTTREQKKLTDYAKLNSYVRYPSMSPRGDKIIYEYAATTGNVWLTELK